MGAKRHPVKFDLTGIELALTRLIADGLSYKQMAEKVGVGVKCISWHVSQIYKRTGTSGIATLTRWAIRNGLISA